MRTIAEIKADIIDPTRQNDPIFINARFQELHWAITNDISVDDLEALCRAWRNGENRWIPCSERLPEPEDADEDGYVLIAEKTTTSERCLDFATYYSVKNNRSCTHWMPLPSLP